MSWIDISLRILSVFLLIGINAFFVITEFSIVSVRRSRINHLVLAGDLPAKTVQSLQSSLDRLLSTTQLGITLSSLALGWIGESTIAVAIKYLITLLPLPIFLTKIIIHSISIPLAFIVLVYLQIVLGELVPKSIALLYSEQISRFLAPASLVISRVFNPFIGILNKSTHFLLKLIGIEYTGQGWYKQVTSEELQLMIKTEKESPSLEAEERELLNNVLEFGDIKGKEIMTPHVNIKALSVNATYHDLLAEVATTKHSCYPVKGESLDDIKGIIDLKDLACDLAENSINLDTPITKLIKPTRFLSESILLTELLPIMQEYPLKMVIIVDEYGGTSGLITKQDLIKEIIGDDNENKSEKESLINIIDEKTFIVSAQINVEELNESLELNLPLIKDYQTLGGFLFYQWQKIPQLGETFTFDNLKFTVIKVEDRRLKKIKISRLK